jgi:hypothetical protein
MPASKVFRERLSLALCLRPQLLLAFDEVLEFLAHGMPGGYLFLSEL